MFDDGLLVRFVWRLTLVHPDVRSAFPTFIAPYEGRCGWMYLDTKGLVTTGVGNLIDPLGPTCYAMPWKDKYGAIATPAAVADEWRRVKALQSMAKRGGLAFANITTLRLTNLDIDQIVLQKLDEVAKALAARAPFARFEDWPAPAQLAVLDMAWNMGPEFDFPRFEAAAAVQDWATCAVECRIKDAPQARNDAHRALFIAAEHAPDLLSAGWAPGAGAAS